MAISDSHRLGQSIGILIEDFIGSILIDRVPKEYFIDSVKEYRPVTNSTKVCWVDFQGNKHDLDFVIEEDGDAYNLGRPKAFIECAWRRYTKHSKNKVQEIQGAILPLAETFKNEHPFLGVILAGEFTAPSIQQLESTGFHVLYIEYFEIVQACNAVNIDISFNEKTSLDDLKIKADMMDNIDNQAKKIILLRLFEIVEFKINTFVDALITSLLRTIKFIAVQPLYSHKEVFMDVESARNYVNNANLDSPGNLEFTKIFIYVEYNTGSTFRAECMNKIEALNFLGTL